MFWWGCLAGAVVTAIVIGVWACCASSSIASEMEEREQGFGFKGQDDWD